MDRCVFVCVKGAHTKLPMKCTTYTTEIGNRDCNSFPSEYNLFSFSCARVFLTCYTFSGVFNFCCVFLLWLLLLRRKRESSGSLQEFHFTCTYTFYSVVCRPCRPTVYIGSAFVYIYVCTST